MKGVLNFLEKTGFVSRKGEETESSPMATTSGDSVTEPLRQSIAAAPPATPVDVQLGLNLAQIYELGGISASSYSAEKLLRLLDGLKVMDEATRRTAVAAMDAADDSWTIEDPIRDAMAKTQVLNDRVGSLRLGLEQAEAETTSLLMAVKEREVSTVNDIKRQITDLEGLMAREIARSAQEQSALAADMQTKRDAVNQQIEQINAMSTEFRRLIAQFGTLSGSPSAADKAG